MEGFGTQAYFVNTLQNSSVAMAERHTSAIQQLRRDHVVAPPGGEYAMTLQEIRFAS